MAIAHDIENCEQCGFVGDGVSVLEEIITGDIKAERVLCPQHREQFEIETEEVRPGVRSLEGLVDRNAERGLPTQVLVNGVGTHYPDDVLKVAQDVADLIATDGNVLNSGFDDLDDDDVALLELSTKPRTNAAADQEKLRELASTARANSYAGIVCYGSNLETSKGYIAVLDAIVEVREDRTVQPYRVKHTQYENEIYHIELDSMRK